MLPDPETLTLTDLLQYKRSISQATSQVLSALGSRLNNLVAARIAPVGAPIDATSLTISWEDITLFVPVPGVTEVLVGGTRFLQVGDEVEDEDGTTIVITEQNVDLLAQRIRLKFPIEILSYLEDPSVPISEVVKMIDRATVVDTPITTPWLYQTYNASKMRH